MWRECRQGLKDGRCSFNALFCNLKNFFVLQQDVVKIKISWCSKDGNGSLWTTRGILGCTKFVPQTVCDLLLGDHDWESSRLMYDSEKVKNFNFFGFERWFLKGQDLIRFVPILINHSLLLQRCGSLCLALPWGRMQWKERYGQRQKVGLKTMQYLKHWLIR